MTFEEAIKLANQGNLEVMQLLGSHYYDQSEYGDARDWYCKAAFGGSKGQDVCREHATFDWRVKSFCSSLHAAESPWVKLVGEC